MALLGATENASTELSQLLASHNGYAQKPITILSGAGVLARGTVLGLNTTSYEYDILAPAATDGTEVARAVLIDDIDATSAAVKCNAYVLGKMHAADLIWPAGITDAQKNTALLNLQDRGLSVDADYV